MCSDKGKISEIFYFERMDLGMFNRFGPSLKTRVQLKERRFDMNISDRNNERMFGVKNGCMILEIIFCRLVTVIPVRSTGKVGVI